MPVSKRLRFEILRRDNHACRYCGASAPEAKLTVDHVTPVTLGGSDDPTNLVAACVDCNAGKSSTPADAAIVADVQADALRWAKAISYAGDALLAEQDRRSDLRDRFRATWDDWHWTDSKGVQHQVDLPSDWTTSVDNILSAGLPIDVLCECVNITMRAKRIKDEFRYMCGIAWRKVAEMREIAGAVITCDEGEGEPSARRVSPKFSPDCEKCAAYYPDPCSKCLWDAQPVGETEQ